MLVVATHSLNNFNDKNTVRLFNKGLEIVEVSDDGSGVPLDSRRSMALPHSTSKIHSFADIYSTTSLGFRGEALYSLCNVSEKVVIATRTRSDAVAQRLEFGPDGSVLSTSELPRKVGTTVAVIRLLSHLPVRRKDLEQRLAQHRTKIVQLVSSYAVFCTGVQIRLLDMVNNVNEKTILSSTVNSKTLRDTISAVRGPKFLSSLSKVTASLPDTIGGGTIVGYITAANVQRVGKGQCFSINRRPVDLPKVSKLLNDAFRGFGGDRVVCFLECTLPPGSYDINLSPDKRQVLLTHEADICAAIVAAVTELWSSQTEGQFESKELDILDELGDSSRGSNRSIGRRYAFVHDPKKAVAKENEEDAKKIEYESSPERRRPPPMRVGPPAKRARQSFDESSPSDHEQPSPRVVSDSLTGSMDDDSSSPVASDLNPTSSSTETTPHTTVTPAPPSNPVSETARQTATLAEERQFRTVQAKFNRAENSHNDERPSEESPFALQTETGNVEQEEQPVKRRSFGLERFGFKASKSTAIKTTTSRSSTTSTTESFKRSTARVVSLGGSSRGVVRSELNLQSRTVSVDKTNGEAFGAEKSAKSDRDDSSDGEEALRTTVQKIAKKTPVKWGDFQSTEHVIQATVRDRKAAKERKHRVPLIRVDSHDSKDDESEDEAQEKAPVSLSKSDFETMQVVGQFNMGFIVARSKEGNVWILDQHACDEKYNFEKLCRETVIHEQRLLAPLPLELSPSEETCVLDFMEIFEKNGFRFNYDETKPPRHRLSLTALPHSGAQDGRKAVQFGKDDVSALCAILSPDEDEAHVAIDGGTGVDGQGMYGNNAVRRYTSSTQTQTSSDDADKIIARLPKTIAMFASRACRSSIMIGTALSENEMNKIVKRLSDVENPWSCPHGRPTMRHVADMRSFSRSDEKRASAHISGPTVTAMTQDTSD